MCLIPRLWPQELCLTSSIPELVKQPGIQSHLEFLRSWFGGTFDATKAFQWAAGSVGACIQVACPAKHFVGLVFVGSGSHFCGAGPKARHDNRKHPTKYTKTG